VRPNFRGAGQCDYKTIEDATIADLVRACARNGAAVMFGLTSDKGAYSIVVLSDNDKIKEYPNDKEGFERLASWVAEVYFGDP
jgi:hypothetical protein